MTAVGSKCKVCKCPAVIDLPRHNAHFCSDHLQQLCRRQMVKAIDDFDMLQADDRILGLRACDYAGAQTQQILHWCGACVRSK